jgi:hypothetical protein
MSFVWIACFASAAASACAAWFDSKGENRELYTVVKPGPVKSPWDLLEPTPPRTECGRACSTPVVEETAVTQGEVPTALAESATAACAGVPADRRGVSPFVRRELIDEVHPITEDGQLTGARVVFKPHRNVSADIVRRQIACERAINSTAGAVATAQPPDPTLVEGADVNVIDRGGRVEVIVTSPTPDRAAVVLARARGESATETARR